MVPASCISSRHRRRRLQRDLAAQGAAVGARVQGHHPVAAQRGEGGTQRRGDRGLAHAPLQRQHRDPIAALQRPVHPGDQVVVAGGARALPEVDQLPGQHIQQPAPALRRRRLDRPQQHAGRQLRVRRVGHRLGPVGRRRRGAGGRREFTAARRLDGSGVVGAESGGVDPRDAGGRGGIPRGHPGVSGGRRRCRRPRLGRRRPALRAEAGEAPGRRVAGIRQRVGGLLRRQLGGRWLGRPYA